MRTFFSSLLLVLAFGCGTEINRLDGTGCQPACSVQVIEGDDVVTSVCLDENEEPGSCAEMSLIAPVCPTGRITCDTESGLPECEGASIEGTLPFCGR